MGRAELRTGRDFPFHPPDNIRGTRVMAADDPMVFVVDDDSDVRTSIEGLLESVGLRCTSFRSAEEFLHHRPADGPSCLILDVRLPGESGLDFQMRLIEAGVAIPIIFITGHGDIP